MLEQPEAAAYIVMIYTDGAIQKDGRLKPFDKITEIDGKKITSDMSQDEVRKLFRLANIRVSPSPIQVVDYYVFELAVNEFFVHLTHKEVLPPLLNSSIRIRTQKYFYFFPSTDKNDRSP